MSTAIGYGNGQRDLSGANGARLALAPQKDWAVNNPEQLAIVLAKLNDIKDAFNNGNKRQVSLADLIVLGGAAAIEKAAADAGVDIDVPTALGRGDATQAQTDVDSFNLLKPSADAFRKVRCCFIYHTQFLDFYTNFAKRRKSAGVIPVLDFY